MLGVGSAGGSADSGDSAGLDGGESGSIPESAEPSQMFFYKAPQDDRGWTYVGLLCRLAVEIGLDRTPASDAPDASEYAQRTRRNRIRTWMLSVNRIIGRSWR